MVIFRHVQIALFHGLLGLLGELLAAGFRFRFQALGGRFPGFDLFFHRRLDGWIGGAGGRDRHFLGGGRDLGDADVLGLEERPQVRRLDILADRFGLRAFAGGFREGQEQRQDRDHQRDPFVEAFAVLAFLRFLDRFVDFRHGVRPLCRTRQTTNSTNLTRAGGRRDKRRSGARRRLRYKFAWSPARRGRAVPGSSGCRRRGRAGAWRRNAAARAALRSPAGRARRAAAPWRAG